MSNRLLLFNALSTASKLRSIASPAAIQNGHTSVSIAQTSCRLSSTEALSSTDDHSSQPHDDEDIRFGTVFKYHDIKKYGFILPEGKSPPFKSTDLIFFHCADIKTPIQNKTYAQAIHPHLKHMTKLQFKLRTAPNSNNDGGSSSTKHATSLQAHDITLKGGRLIPPFGKLYLDKYIKSKKAQMGDRVYEIMDNVQSGGGDTNHQDGMDMERRIVEEFEECCRSIDAMKVKVGRIEEIYERVYEEDEEL